MLHNITQYFIWSLVKMRLSCLCFAAFINLQTINDTLLSFAFTKLLNCCSDWFIKVIWTVKFKLRFYSKQKKKLSLSQKFLWSKRRKSEIVIIYTFWWNSSNISNIGQVGRVFTNGRGDMDSIPGCIIPKTLKMVLDATLLNTQQYKVRIKGKVSNPGKGVAPSPTSRCSSYWKGSLLVALDYGRQLYLLLQLMWW